MVLGFIKGFISETLSNQKTVKRNALIQIVIATLAFIMLVRVYPMRAMQKHTHSKQQAVDLSGMDLSGEEFTSDDKKLQTVYFAEEHLYRLTLYVNCAMPEGKPAAGTVLFRLYDETFSCVYEEDYSCKDIERDGYLRAAPDMEVDAGKPYYYEILVPKDCPAKLALPVADKNALAQAENGTLYIDGIINDAVCLIADFDYSQPLSVWGILLYGMLIIIMAVMLYILVMWAVYYYDWKFAAYHGRLAKCARIGASMLVGAAAVYLLIESVLLNRFGGAGLDRLFFAVGITAGVLWLLGALWFPVFYAVKKKESPIPPDRKISLIWRNYLQTVSFGLLFYALCQYVNADREYFHHTNTRWMLIFLAIAFLMMYSEKQFLNKLSLIWLVLGIIGSALYCDKFAGDEKELLLAKLTCGVVVAWGLLLVNMLLQVRFPKRGQAFGALREYMRACHPIHRPQMIALILWIVFSALMFVYRFEKVWVYTAALPFAALFFLRCTPASKSRLLKNFTNGILLSFGLVTLFCLLHRPHHYWMLYRYGGIFHTVACTGMYLAVALGAAVGKLYGRLRSQGNMLVKCFYEFFIVACVVGFIILTMSRTAFLTSTVNIAMVAALAAVTYRKPPKRVMQEFGMLAAVIAVSFPLVFTAVRMAPAVVNDPVRYEVEFQDDSFMVCKGDPIDSDKYMTVRRFFSALFGRFQNERVEDGRVEDGRIKDKEAEKGASSLLAYTGNDFAGIELWQAADGEGDASDADSGRNDISNGRFGIFREYFKALELKGHPKMAPPNEQGEEHAHAHNSYLQVAYNFGMIAGVVFLLLCVLTLWSAIRLYYTQGRKYSIYMVPFSLIVAFGFVSLTEWAFHPCIPAGFCYLFLQTLLIKD